MLNTTLRNGLMLLIWLCLIFSVRAEEVPFLAPQQRPQLEANQPWPTMTSKTMPPTSVIFRCAPAHSMSRSPGCCITATMRLAFRTFSMRIMA